MAQTIELEGTGSFFHVHEKYQSQYAKDNNYDGSYSMQLAIDKNSPEFETLKNAVKAEGIRTNSATMKLRDGDKVLNREKEPVAPNQWLLSAKSRFNVSVVDIEGNELELTAEPNDESHVVMAITIKKNRKGEAAYYLLGVQIIEQGDKEPFKQEVYKFCAFGKPAESKPAEQTDEEFNEEFDSNLE